LQHIDYPDVLTDRIIIRPSLACLSVCLSVCLLRTLNSKMKKPK